MEFFTQRVKAKPRHLNFPSFFFPSFNFPSSSSAFSRYTLHKKPTMSEESHHRTPNSPPTTVGPTTFAPPPPPSPSFSEEISPPPTYRPICAPAIPPDPQAQHVPGRKISDPCHQSEKEQEIGQNLPNLDESSLEVPEMGQASAERSNSSLQFAPPPPPSPSFSEEISPPPTYRHPQDQHVPGRKISDKASASLKRKRSSSSSLQFDDIRKHFDVPINLAAKKMNIGVTLLKNRCRELNITRWPHRKLSSLTVLINNLKEMGLTKEVAMLEKKKKKMLEKSPKMELNEEIKKLRQACFKATYKKRRLVTLNP